MPVQLEALTSNNSAELVAVHKESGGRAVQMRKKLKTVLIVPPGRIVQSLKDGVGDSSRRIKCVRRFMGHRDGIWDVDIDRSHSILASASADHSCQLWSLDIGTCYAQYFGHTGSVNDVSFSPTHPESSGHLLLATVSGDRTAHIWTAPFAGNGQQLQALSSDEEIENKGQRSFNEESMESDAKIAAIRQPLRVLTGHNGVVISVSWLFSGDQLITASWDRTANIYDAERGEILNVLSGHDDELNHCSTHPTQKLFVTCSRDSTFRLWDFRDTIQSVAVFQGHTDSITSVVFASGDKLVSGSDDRSIKVWDLRNMRIAIASVRLSSAANRLAVSSRNHVVIPHDNRNIRIYDLNSFRLTRISRSSQHGHRRMVCGAAWADDHPLNDLVTCGFDKQIIAWKTSFGKE